MDFSWLGPGELRRFKREEYDRLVAMGMFEDENVELLHGLLVAKEPQGSDHSYIASHLHRALVLALGNHVEVLSHSPFGASSDSEPEPDVAVVPPRYYGADHPTEAFLLVEVAKSSLRRDREVKSAIYADAGVKEYWIIDVAALTVEVWSQPGRGAYQRLDTFRRGESITLQAFPDVTIAVDDFLR